MRPAWWTTVLGLVLSAAAARGQVSAWSNPAGGCWCDALNWTPMGTPTPGRGVRVNLPGAYAVRSSPSGSLAGTLSMTNPLATLDIRMGEAVRLYATDGTHRIDGVVKIGDGSFGNPAVLEITGNGSHRLTGAGRIVLHARPELVTPFAVIRASLRPVALGAGLSLLGRGAVQAQLTCEGTISPGLTPGGIGEFQIDQLALTPTAVVAFDIAGPSFMQFDRLQINSLGIRGGTVRVRLAGGYTPPVGASFQLVIGPFTGTFAAVDAPGFVVEPGTGLTVRWVGVPCDPDVNRDGNADQDDVAYLVEAIGGGANPHGVDPDFNRDGNADQDDVAALINAVAGGPCP
jgi:hypothetical protein